MKNTLSFLLLLTMAFSCTIAHAQVITHDNRVLDKNIVIGLKGGVNGLGMKYTAGTGKEKIGFYNPSAIEQGFSNMTGCLKGGITVERVVPRFSYGLEILVESFDAKAPAESDDPHYATMDSAIFASVRLPLKVKFCENSLVSPYLFVAPGLSTYVSDSIGGKYIEGCSSWNNSLVHWGTKNTISWNVNVVAGVGVQGRIPIDLYEFYIRLEGGYNFGFQNLNPKDSGLSFERKMKGWEATIGVAFPLFINASYSWLN